MKHISEIIDTEIENLICEQGYDEMAHYREQEDRWEAIEAKWKDLDDDSILDLPDFPPFMPDLLEIDEADIPF